MSPPCPRKSGTSRLFSISLFFFLFFFCVFSILAVAFSFFLCSRVWEILVFMGIDEYYGNFWNRCSFYTSLFLVYLFNFFNVHETKLFFSSYYRIESIVFNRGSLRRQIFQISIKYDDRYLTRIKLKCYVDKVNPSFQLLVSISSL